MDWSSWGQEEKEEEVEACDPRCRLHTQTDGEDTMAPDACSALPMTASSPFRPPP